MRLIALVICSASLVLGASDPITDESLRLEALRAVFPGMAVADTGKHVKAPKVDRATDPNAFAGEKIYRVVGDPQNETEHYAAQSVINLHVSSMREVALRVYSWPQSSTELVAILQYKFPGSDSPMSYLSIGMVVHLSRRQAKLTATEQIEMDTTHHSAINGIQFVDLTGDGFEELVVESDDGGGGMHVSEMHIFDLSRGMLVERLVVNSRVRTWHENPEEYTLKLDAMRSRQSKGASFCFVKTAYMENDQEVTPPRVTNVCLPARDNLNPR